MPDYVYMPPNGSIDIIHTGTSGYGFGNSAGMFTDEIKRFQTFIAPARCTGINGITVKLRRVAGNATGRANVELYKTVNGLPAGAPLADGSANRAIGTAFETVYCNLSASGLVPGAVYAVVLSAPPNSNASLNNRFEWAVAPVYGNLRFGKWNGKTWVDESGLGNGWLAVGAFDVDNAIDITHSGTQGVSFGQSQDQLMRFQTFLARYNQPMTGVDLKLRKILGTGQSDVVAELYACVNHQPVGGTLASAVIPGDSVGTAWTVVNAPLFYPALLFEHEYAVVLTQRVLSSQALYEWAVSPVSKTTYFGKWSSSSWVDESQFGDGWLKVWLMPPIDIPTVDIYPAAPHGNGFGNNTDEIKRYETFTLSQWASVAGVDLWLRKYNGTSQSDVVADLYATSGNRPVGASIASGTIPASQIGTQFTVTHLPLKSGALAAGTYALVLSQRTPQPARYEWAVGQVNVNKAFGKWNGASWIDESWLGAGWTRVWITAADITIDLSHAAQNGYGFGNVTDELKRFQTFTTPETNENFWYSLNGIQLKVRKVFGSDQSDLIAELYETKNNLPTGSPRTTAVIPSSYVRTDWTIVNLPLCFDGLDYGGKKYAVVLSQRQARAARYEWAAAPVSAGQQFGKWNGSSWIDESGLGDGWLKVSLIEFIGPN